MSQVVAYDGIDQPMTENSQTSQGVLLSSELAALREATGMTQSAFARKIGAQVSTINKVERTKRYPREQLLRHWLTVCGVDDDGIEDFVRRARSARNPTWWADHKGGVPTWFERYLRLEEAAVRALIYESELVPGLMQTRRYTEAVAAAVARGGPSDRGERLAAVRTTRQRRLTTPRRPLVVTAVLNESVIRRPVGGHEVMAEQLAYLANLASRHTNVTLHVLPFAAREHPSMTGTFTMLQYSQEQINTVYLEHPNGATYVDKPVDVAHYEASFAQLVHLALGEAETIELIVNTGRELIDE